MESKQVFLMKVKLPHDDSNSGRFQGDNTDNPSGTCLSTVDLASVTKYYICYILVI